MYLLRLLWGLDAASRCCLPPLLRPTACATFCRCCQLMELMPGGTGNAVWGIPRATPAVNAAAGRSGTELTFTVLLHCAVIRCDRHPLAVCRSWIGTLTLLAICGCCRSQLKDFLGYTLAAFLLRWVCTPCHA